MIKRMITKAICAHLGGITFPPMKEGQKESCLPVFAEPLRGDSPGEALHFCFIDSHMYKMPGGRFEFEGIGMISILTSCHKENRVQRLQDIADAIVLDGRALRSGEIEALLSMPEVKITTEAATIKFRVCSFLLWQETAPKINNIFYQGRIQ